jgi:tetratricopeptide (TPR) repeat protein
MAAAAIAAALILAVVSFWIGRRQPAGARSGGEVVELLLEQSRPFEARMTAQPYRPILRTRGVEDNGAGVSYSSLAQEMTTLSASAYDMGRFYLLQKDFKRAISYLESAARDPRARAAVHNDLGAAYIENGPPIERAESEFQQAIEKDRSFAPAVFNLALFYEHTNAVAKAEAQWKQYLELDSRSEWAEEVRGKLRGLTR